MRNWNRRPGVYLHMLRLPLFLIALSFALAQQRPQQDPFDAAVQAVWQAQSKGNFEESATRREQVRAMLQQMPIDLPRFGFAAQQVAQLYGNSGLSARARVILQEALARATPLGESHPVRIPILTALGDAWQQDRNLLKAVSYLEQAAIAHAAMPPAATSPPATSPFGEVQSGRFFMLVNRAGGFASSGGGYFGRPGDTYVRLASLYQQLGSPDAVAAIAAKIRALASKDEAALARFYEQHGPLEEAAAIYKKLAEQAPDPQQRSNAAQALANHYARQERYSDAAAALQIAIATVQSSDQPGIRGQALWMTQNLANYMHRAGLVDQADQVYQQLLQQYQGDQQESAILSGYSRHLADTNRIPQAEKLLTDYLEAHPDLSRERKMDLYFNLANAARLGGNANRAEEYQKAAQALQPQPTPPPAGQLVIQETMRKMQVAIGERRLDDAYNLAMSAIDNALRASDGQQIVFSISMIAQQLASNKEPAKAEQLFQRVFQLAQEWSAQTTRPLVTVAQGYARFLMTQPDRLGDVPAAIERYRSVLIDANGADSGTLVEPLRMRIEFALLHPEWQKPDALVRELLDLQESLSGATSAAYLEDLQIAARAYEVTGDPARALPLLRKTVAIADLVAGPMDSWRRSQTRTNAALALARQGEFDEAEKLAEEALALPRTGVPGGPAGDILAQIRRMRRGAPAAGTISVTGGSIGTGH